MLQTAAEFVFQRNKNLYFSKVLIKSFFFKFFLEKKIVHIAAVQVS
jgi:hypothetical protein